ncbi:MAG: ABC transporter substrate-binding protein [Xanthobacteraceae bacterium]|jgi:4,5-dihydroxyphthalate decarboxylase
MSKVKLTFACGLYDRVLPLYTGAVSVEGVDLDFLNIDSPRDIFDRMAAKQEFDVSEFSSSEYVSRYAHGQCPFVALPVFPSRTFRHSFIAVNRRFVKTPKDLEGKRIGLPMYTMTASIFIKGLLQQDCGVDLSKITWVEGQINAADKHGNPSTMPLVRPVAIEKNSSGKSLSDLLEAGEIQAIIGTGMPDALGKNPDVVRLFPKFRDTEKDYYKRTKIFPVMHLVAIRKDVYERNPFIGKSLYEAFDAAKNHALGKMRYTGALRYMLPWLPDDLDEINDVFGGDPWPYGIEANRPTLEALVLYLHDQGLIKSQPKLEELFLPFG